MHFFLFISQIKMINLQKIMLKILDWVLWMVILLLFQIIIQISYSWKQQKSTPKSLKNNKPYGKFSDEKLRQARSSLICTISRKSRNLTIRNQNQNLKNRSTQKNNAWLPLRNALKRRKFSILSSLSPRGRQFIQWISSRKERHSL